MYSWAAVDVAGNVNVNFYCEDVAQSVELNDEFGPVLFYDGSFKYLSDGLNGLLEQKGGIMSLKLKSNPLFSIKNQINSLVHFHE